MKKSLIIAIALVFSFSTITVAVEKKVVPKNTEHVETVSFYETSRLTGDPAGPMKVSMEKASRFLRSLERDRFISMTQTSACSGVMACSAMVTIIYVQK